MSEVISQELFKDISDAKTRQLLEQVVQRSGLTADEVTTEFMALLEKDSESRSSRTIKKYNTDWEEESCVFLLLFVGCCIHAHN